MVKGALRGAFSIFSHARRVRMMYHRPMAFGFHDHQHDTVAGVPVIRATREQCPVCGHPTGDCTGDSSPPKRIWGLGDVPSMEESQTVLVGEDIFEERQITPFTKRQVLIARAGQKIPLTKARELGII